MARLLTETFGFDRPRPWSLTAFQLLFHAPRVFVPLAEAWELRFPGTRRALARLEAGGWVAHQGAVVLDTRTGRPARRPGRPVPRYRTTAAGTRLAAAAAEDVRVLEDRFPRISAANATAVAAMLQAFVLDPPGSRIGVSVATAAAGTGLAERSARWWTGRLLDAGLLVRLPRDLSDVREVVPEHWRVTRRLCRELDAVLDAVGAEPGLRVAFRLRRRRFLGDVMPTRLGRVGNTDYDHDVEAQRVIAALVRSGRCAPAARFEVEPHLQLPVTGPAPAVFRASGTNLVHYVPDAVMTAFANDRSAVEVLEYERFQSRRDAWAHVERFLGWLHLHEVPFRPATLRFVVDSVGRERSYVELIEAFADYALDHPDRLPRNPVQLSVSSVPRLAGASDALDDRYWFKVALPAATEDPRPVLHDTVASPYDDYFGRRPG